MAARAWSLQREGHREQTKPESVSLSMTRVRTWFTLGQFPRSPETMATWPDSTSMSGLCARAPTPRGILQCSDKQGQLSTVDTACEWSAVALH